MPADLEAALGYDFADAELLTAALVHRSYSSENVSVPDNERLEFLGDAVLQLVVTEFLFENHSDLAEGEMAKVRAACVNRGVLADLAGALGVGVHVVMSAGEELSGGRSKPSILADAMEAILASIYLDGGLQAAREVIHLHWADLIRAKAEDPGRRDFKTRLQERVAADGLRPEYLVTGTGPDHERQFAAVVLIDGMETGRGTGRSKKEAEQAAAQAALER